MKSGNYYKGMNSQFKSKYHLQMHEGYFVKFIAFQIGLKYHMDVVCDVYWGKLTKAICI